MRQSLLQQLRYWEARRPGCHIKYLKVENQILRSKLPGRITVTPKERHRLVKFAQKLGKSLHQLATIVKPSTLLRWIREETKSSKKVPAKRGRRRTPEQIRRLILKLARENEWGYTRILGELRKLGIRSTVKRILKDAGLDPGPQRGQGTWDDFLKQHAASLWQCDFSSKKVLTIKGIRDAFVIAFLNVKTRQVILSPATLHPNQQWVVAQAESFVKQARDQRVRVKSVQRDRDTKFTRSFDRTLKASRVKVVKNAYRSPNTNAYVERFIQSISTECLDRFVIFGERHMDTLCAEYLAHYHEERPHQSLDNEPLRQRKPRGRPKTHHGPLDEQIVPLTEVQCKQRLGGLLKSYSRQAA